MIHRTAGERRMRRSRGMAAAALVLLGLLAVSLLDRVVYDALTWPPERRALGEMEDWYQMLRTAGYLPAWLGVGAAIVLLGRGGGQERAASRRAATVVLGALTAGLAAEVVKLLVGRERPEVSGVDGAWQGYVFRAPLGAFADSSNLGFPSSHAATAFGGAFALAAAYPPLRWLALALACGCGLTRVLAGAHFASDVYGGCVLGWACARWWWRGLSERWGWGGAALPRWERAG
ncbi:MAG TPA: phosphatase PAP2 family protein [Phycisphaerales bacterium]|nr:phosphatase PAP2 family protein [Phycisphaerales bacterium]